MPILLYFYFSKNVCNALYLVQHVTSYTCLSTVVTILVCNLYEMKKMSFYYKYDFHRYPATGLYWGVCVSVFEMLQVYDLANLLCVFFQMVHLTSPQLPQTRSSSPHMPLTHRCAQSIHSGWTLQDRIMSIAGRPAEKTCRIR